jgi:16S rRNA A1518/A1519 N6-dimethyltransferase RsmA/KsgA/DIM1 with predicted DNA glycosylase/AP lyase activity
MIWLLAVIPLLFALVVFFGAPYLPTHQKQVSLALDLLNLKKGQLLIDLGAGDGRLVKAAAQRGWRAVGYELNPILVIWCWFNLRAQRGRARVVWRDFFKVGWPADTKAIYIFGSQPVMRRLAKKLANAPRPIQVISYGFELPGHKAQTTQGGFFLYDID